MMDIPSNTELLGVIAGLKRAGSRISRAGQGNFSAAFAIHVDDDAENSA